MLFVDAQVHIWGANTPERPCPEGRGAPHRAQPFSKDDLLKEMDAAGVARVVIVPPSWEGDCNDLALEAARLHPGRFAVMGRPPAEPRPLGNWRDQPGMLGLRVTSNTAEARALFDDLPKLLRLARLPNVAVKASALPASTTHDYPYYNLHPYLRRVFDAFGPCRMFWGTDLTRLPCTYRQAITMFTEELPWLSAADQEWVMGRGICEWLGWPLPN